MISLDNLHKPITIIVKMDLDKEPHNNLALVNNLDSGNNLALDSNQALDNNLALDSNLDSDKVVLDKEVDFNNNNHLYNLSNKGHSISKTMPNNNSYSNNNHMFLRDKI
jgi:hypothetical protein